MTEIKTFYNEEFGNIRTITMPDGQVGFVGKDLAKALGYNQADKAIMRHVDEDDRMKCTVTDAMGRQQLAYVINESGFYSLVLSSKLTTARLFKRWVTSEVLPQIRQTGGYLPVNDNDTPEELMARALLMAQKTIEQRDALLEEKQRIIEAQRPKADFCDAVMSSVNSCLIGSLAKMIKQNGVDCGEKRLFEWMRRAGFLGKSGERYNIPNQRFIEQELFELKETVHTENEQLKTSFTTKVTGKGQEYFINGFISGRFNLNL